MEGLFTCQEEILDRLTRAEKNYRKSPKDRIKVSYLQTRLQMLDGLWEEFTNGHKVIVTAAEAADREHTYFTETSEKFEKLYVEYKRFLLETLSTLLPPQPQPVTFRSD